MEERESERAVETPDILIIVSVSSSLFFVYFKVNEFWKLSIKYT